MKYGSQDRCVPVAHMRGVRRAELNACVRMRREEDSDAESKAPTFAEIPEQQQPCCPPRSCLPLTTTLHVSNM